MEMISWKRIDITEDIDSDTFAKATELASKVSKGTIPKLTFTESNPRWILLYNHARQGQIRPEILHKMKRSDLYFLAGHSFPHPGLVRQPSDSDDIYRHFKDAQIYQGWDQVTKLQGNAARAKMELERRNFFWASLLAILAALLGGLLSSRFFG